MKQLLYKLDSVLKVKNVGLYEKLAAPLTDNSITQLSAEVKFPLPDEVKELFKWKNGTILTENVALGSFWLMPLNTFADIEGSVQYYKNALEIYNDYNRIPENYFPLFHSGGGERTFVDIDPASDSFLKLFFYTLSDPDVDIINEYSDSIASFLQSIITCYEEDVYYCEKDGFLNCLEKKESQIFYKNNPGSNYWHFYNEVYSNK